MRPPDAARRVLIVGCGALARELVALTRDLPNVDLTCLPASLHNRPGGIPAAVRERIRSRRSAYDAVFVAYADCGTGGMLDRVLEEEGVERLPGAHCYEVFAGRETFERLSDGEPATFFLTDFLARNFERLVWRGLGLDRHPELLALYFGNYRRLVYLAQTEDAALRAAGERAARRLGLAFEYRFTGLGDLAAAIAPFRAPGGAPGTGPRAEGRLHGLRLPVTRDRAPVSRKRATPPHRSASTAGSAQPGGLGPRTAPRPSLPDGNRFRAPRRARVG